ncbi:MAG: hypothetical protein ABI877_09545 [Gemmatimonadaceae bacterium]
MPKPSLLPTLTAAIVAAFLIVGAAVALKYSAFDDPARTAIALVPVVAYVVFGAAMISYVRQLDGLQQRIALEAITFAATASGFIALVYGQLEKARVVPSINVGFFVAVLLISYATGYAVSVRRYQ